MRPSRLLTASTLAALATLSSASLAAPSAKERAEARALVSQAKRAMKGKRWADAVSALKKAERLDPSPAVAMDLAAAQAAAGKLVAARATLVAVATPAAVPARRPTLAEVRARDAAKKALADLERRVPTVQVKVAGPPAGQATTLVDGVEVTGDEIPVNPGDHTIRAEADGFAPEEKDVYLAEGAHERVRLQLAPARAQVASDAPAAEAPHGSRVPGAVVMSLGGAALVAGGVFGGIAFHDTSLAKTQCQGNQCPADTANLISRSKMWGNLSTGFLVGGGVVAAAGIALVIVAPGGGKADEAPKAGVARISPWAGPGGAGLVAGGSF